MFMLHKYVCLTHNILFEIIAVNAIKIMRTLSN